MSEKSSKSSANEMVEKAKRRASDKSREVVVRDGEVMVKVRKKKRRKESIVEQLQKVEEREKKMHVKLLLGLIGFLVLLSLIVAGIAFFKIAIYNSPDHIVKLEESLSQKLNAEAIIEQYRLGPTTSSIKKFKFVSSSPELPRFEANFSNVEIPHKPESLVLGSLNGGSARIKKAKISIDYQSTERSKPPVSKAPYEPYGHDSFSTDSLDINLLTGSKLSPAILNSEADLIVKSGSDRLILRNGEFKNADGFPSKLVNASFANYPDRLEIEQFKLGSGSAGVLNIKGSYLKSERSAQTLQANFDNLRLEMVSEVLGNIVEARVSSTDGTIVVSPVEKTIQLNADLKCSSAGFTLKGMEFLSSIGEFFGDVSYPYVVFRGQSKASLQVDNEGYKFAGVDLEKVGVMSVSGNFNLSHSGQLGGNLRVGVPLSTVLKFYPKVNRESLTTSRSYAMFDIELAGTTREAKDNFREQFNSIVDALE